VRVATDDLLSGVAAGHGQEELQPLVNDLLLHLIWQLITGDVFASLVWVFTGLLGYDTKSNVWRSAALMAPYLSHLIYIFWILILNYIVT
jgi:hypothetical protein